MRFDDTTGPVTRPTCARRSSALWFSALILMLLPVRAQAQTGTIAGAVADAGTGAGINATVVIYNWNGVALDDASTTGTGAYSVGGLAPGFYFARATVPQGVNYVDEAYHDVPCMGGSCRITTTTPIEVRSGLTTTANFPLSPGGSMTGSVTDATTSGSLANIYVAVFDAQGRFVRADDTDALGIWIVRGLAPGTYYAQTSESYLYLDKAYNNIPCTPVCPSPTSTTPITVTGVATTPGINFALTPTVGSIGGISGSVTDASSGSPLNSVFVYIYDSAGSIVGVGFTDPTGAYSVVSLLPGTYYARTFVSQADTHIDEAYDNIPCVPCPAITTTTPIAVGSAPTTGINFPLSVGGGFSGTVTNAATSAPIVNTVISVFSSTGVHLKSVLSGAMGYSVAGLPPGNYFARTFVQPANFVDEAYNNVPCVPCPAITTTTPIAVMSGATTPGISFALAGGGTITGSVSDARTGAPGVFVIIEILTPAGALVKSGSTGFTGVYSVTGLPSGTFYARTAASPFYAAELFNNVPCPHLSCALTSGTAITVTAGSTQNNINFPLLPAGASDVVLDFGSAYGLWMLTSENRFQGLHGLSPIATVTGDLDGNGVDDLVINFGPHGVYAWMNHATYLFIHAASPSTMVTGDLDNDGHDDLILVFPGYGVWRWSHGVWNQMHGADASKLVVGRIDNVAGDDLILDFPGYGLYMYANNSTWSAVHGLSPTILLTADITGNGREDLVAAFPGHGLWALRDGVWGNLHALSPVLAAAGHLDMNPQSDLVFDFGPPYGLWTLRDNSTWAQIHTLSAQSIVLVDRDANLVDETVIDFGPGVGLWQLANNNLPENVLLTDQANPVAEAVSALPNDNPTWSLLHAVSPEDLTVGRFR